MPAIAARLPDARHAARAGMHRAVANMREAPTHGPLAELSAAIGLAGVEQFVTAYPRWPATFGDDLPGALDALRVFIVKAGTGGAMFRSLHATFLHDLGDHLEDSGLHGVASNYDALAEAWVALAASAQRDDHAGGLGAVAAIEDLEPRGVQMMSDWLEARA